jgi:hypothetical protein
MQVNVSDYYPNANYYAYMHKGCAVDKPINSTIEVGMLMYDKENNAIGIVLGCIDESFFGEVRLDSDGMQPITNLRLAKPSDFDIPGVTYKAGLSH